MLLEIRQYILRHGVVSTQQLARAFQLDSQALQPMLDIWVKKGVIRPGASPKNCRGGCVRCDTGAMIYERA